VLPRDPLIFLKDKFIENKRKRAELNKISGSSLEDIEKKVSFIVEQARQYWTGRPSVISYLILGGDLNASITRKTF
jgi:hypothetical protein